MKDYPIETVILRGVFNFIGNPESNFQGPLKKGNRPSVSIGSDGKATSCSILSDVQIALGETKEVEIVVLNQLQLGQKIEKGTVLNVNSPIHKIGEFLITEHLGIWQGGKVP
ncbi:MAG TPA: hypothetical protein VFN30_10400 [Chitinophagaceae bacterium]|nr:hypothetical protein [Chitinophagaceae bacterium]